MIQPEDFDKFIGKIDPRTNTRKYDGASSYFTSNGIGIKFFSPRYSKVTGHRIKYTYKVPELCTIYKQGEWARELPTLTSQANGMGELLFYKRTICGKMLNTMFNIRGPENWCWNYLSAAEIGGVLNANKVRQRDILPEYRTYRVDKFSGKRTTDLPFFSNRKLQMEIATSLHKDVKVVALSSCVNKQSGWEGYVAVQDGASINNGLKIKWWGDTNDWKVIGNSLSLSEKGNIQGVINFESLESGKKFNLGPGQLGNFNTVMPLLNSKDAILGMVAKVQSRQGHEGRAAKFTGEWHLDK